MSLIFTFLCLSPAYQHFVRSCRERRVCPSFSHSLTDVPSPFVMSCRERHVCPFFSLSILPVYLAVLTILYRKGDLHYNEKQLNISSIDD